MYISVFDLSSGYISVKSDIFSFGVLVLEIIIGKRNRGFQHPDHEINLMGHAWALWMKRAALQLVDECLLESCVNSQALRSIQVALLCVQQRPEDRPTISLVVLMLGSADPPLPDPKQPGFFTARNPFYNRDTSSSSKNNPHSVNEVTLTSLDAR
ncbi:unnamed protein product [Linum trigynum]|uniref:S-locus receptor kinase C-terminal domain-containing protein n=1 Tax=Linum trigynum TaxID=586398 RepID=A0AAV2C9P4_9ROSI